MEPLAEQILGLENALLNPDIRTSPQIINNILADGFFEFCSSGQIYHYTYGDKLPVQEDKQTVQMEILHFQLKPITDDSVLATYRLSVQDATSRIKYSLRSSIWQKQDDKWKIIFHQGTLISK